MAFLGRESEADRRRAERFGRWFAARTPFALPAAALGALAVLEFFTLVPLFGLAAVGLGIAGLRDLRRRPHLLGRRLCVAGVALGSLGLTMMLAFWLWLRFGRG